MILEEYVEVEVSGRNKQYYTDKGYDIPTYKNKNGVISVKRGTKILVKISDVSHGSGIIVNVVCDCCGKPTQKTIKDYYKCLENNVYVCHDCSFEKQRKTMIEKYGVENPKQVQEFKEKAKKTTMLHYGVDIPQKSPVIQEKTKITNYEKYGVEYISQSPDVRKKIELSCIEKYGVPVPVQSEEIKEKIKQTTMERYGVSNYACTEEFKEKYKQTMNERYGVDSPLQFSGFLEKLKQTNLEKYGYEFAVMSPDVKEKIKNTNLSRYGVEYTIQNEEIAKKAFETMNKNNTVRTSIQQKYLNNLYDGECNYLFSQIFIDIFDKKNNIAIEYDGGGHDLSVKMEQISELDFYKRQMTRDMLLIKNGINVIHIVSPHDKIPYDDILIKIKEFAIDYFKTGHHWIYFYPEENKYRNAEYREPEGSFFDYGKLRKIKKKEVA